MENLGGGEKKVSIARERRRHYSSLSLNREASHTFPRDHHRSLHPSSRQLSYFHSLRKHRQVKLLPRSIHQPSTGYTLFVHLYTRPLLLLLLLLLVEEERLVAHIYTRGQKYRLGMPRDAELEGAPWHILSPWFSRVQ